jgi:hypothetical protein
VPVAVLAANLGRSVLVAAGSAVLVLTPVFLLFVGRFATAAERVRRGRQLAIGSAVAYSASTFWAESWASVDLALVIAQLALAIRPGLIDLLPERGRFDWAGARIEGLSAPRAIAFDYPFKRGAVAMFGAPFLVRGVLACSQAASEFGLGATVVPALIAALGSGFGYAASLG